MSFQSGLDSALRSRRRIRTLADAAEEELREAIVQGILPPGTALNLKALAEELEMSTTPIREALQRLESDGLVAVDQFRTARVAVIALDDLEDTYSMRIMLEGEAVRRAVPNLTPEHLEYLEAVLQKYEQAYEQQREEEGRQLHEEFHFGIYRHAGSEWLLRLIRPLWSNSERYQRIARTMRRSYGDRVREHREILDPCRQGDAETAAARMVRHLELSRDLVRGFVSKNQDSQG